MKYYDARMIEGCCVFSYTVDMPAAKTEKNLPTKKKTSKKSKQTQSGFLRKFFLPFLLILLVPFALLIDGVCLLTQKAVSWLRAVRHRYENALDVVACILVAVSATALIPLVFLFL